MDHIHKMYITKWPLEEIKLETFMFYLQIGEESELMVNTN
jgi:hypothetical protein